MAILRRIIISLLPLMLTGCYEDFDLGVDVKPVLCMNSLITAGKPIEVQVTRTWLYTDEAGSDNHYVSDAIVTIIVNGEVKNADYLPQEGDTVHLIAESALYGRAEAEVTVPHATPVESFRWKAALISKWINPVDGWEMSADLSFNVNVELDINDTHESDDYYRLSYLGYFHGGEDIGNGYYGSPFDNVSVCYWTPGSFNYEADPIFSEHIGVFESIMGADAHGFSFFTDRQFSGKTYPLHLQFTNGQYYVKSQEWDPLFLDCGYLFTIHKISKSYYDWVNYVWYSDDNPYSDITEAGFGDPVWGYSNVSTGAGVVAAEATTTCEISLSDFLEETLHDYNKIIR